MSIFKLNYPCTVSLIKEHFESTVFLVIHESQICSILLNAQDGDIFPVLVHQGEFLRLEFLPGFISECSAR